jgi:aryl-alcohol dehydrogenase-like predicted oxidoreductase
MTFSKLVLGSAQFGMNYGISNTTGIVSQEKVKKILKISKLNKINMIDTAMAYGKSEEILGGCDISKFKIITKLNTQKSKNFNTQELVDKKIKSSIKKLKINSIYAVLIHNPNDFMGASGDTLLRSLHAQKNEGIIEKIGISIYHPQELNCIKNLALIDLVQAPLNIVDKRLENSGWLSRLYNAGIEVHVRSVFLQGLLLMQRNKIPSKFERWSHIWDEWISKLRENRLNAATVCLSYPLSLPEVDRVIIGIDNMAQLKEIISASKTKIDKKNWSFMESNDLMLINPSNWSDL